MRDTGLLQRAKVAREARQAVHAAFSKVVNRRDKEDPRTQRWLDAVERFWHALAQVYPTHLQEVIDGRRDICEIDTVDVLDFLEADPIFHRSGYMKARLLAVIKKRDLNRDEFLRFQHVVLQIVRTRDCREFRQYCNAAARVDDARLRSELAEILASGDADQKRRARWMLDAVEHANGKTLHR